MAVPTLQPEEFGDFFTALYGYEPFPWQRELAKQVFAATDRPQAWPDALDVPTGAGKTAAIDIAVFHLALEADRGERRRAPVRILFVVDRRLVVDDAYQRARHIADKLRPPTHGKPDSRPDILRRVAECLMSLAGPGAPPLAVARLRGGLPKEPDWVRAPCQPVVVISTVDQVGSRLLFRGYGISDSMKPVHAGLLGADALLLLDEAHLSQPFLQTARAVREVQSELHNPAPLCVVTLSATQVESDALHLEEADWKHDVLGARLNAVKPTELVKVEATSESPAFTEAFAERAWAASRAGGGRARVVAVVVNRVQRARAIHAALVKRLRAAGSAPETAVLLTGRCRAVDREKLLKDVLPAMKAQDPKTDGEPLVVVATQCVESGADLDFDALFTEIAPLDCLRQRFGRLNRMGRHIEVLAAVLAAKDQLGAREVDPIYGTALGETWELLDKLAQTAGKGKGARRVIDFGLAAMHGRLPEGKELLHCLAPREDAPFVLPAYIDLWSQTSPVPAVDPEVAFFLHGPHSSPAEVEIIWRADLNGEQPDQQTWIERVRVCPPSAPEALALPLHVARSWLSGDRPGEVSDCEGREVSQEAAEPQRGRPVLRWRGDADEKTRIIYPREVRPGDVLVVPASYGGCDRFGWEPSSSTPVEDQGEAAYLKQRGRSILRLALLKPLETLLAGLSDASDKKVCEELAAREEVPAEWRQWLDDAHVEVLRDDEGRPLAAMVEREVEPEGAGDAATEDDEGTERQGLKAVLLTVHSQGVEERARKFAKGAGLPDPLADAVALAAYLHDAGKAHPAFKRWLYGGDELAAQGPALAKSGKAKLSMQARERAGLPPGARHEAASVGFALAHPRWQQLKDQHYAELVLWLVGSHHGWGRPFFPAVAWPGGESFTADLGDGEISSVEGIQPHDPGSGWPDLFFRLKQRYGPWELARMEAILRLADHRQSEAEQKKARRRKESTDVPGAG